jgi:uncharacterized protein
MQNYNRNDYSQKNSYNTGYSNAVPVDFAGAGANTFINRVYGWMCGGLVLSATLAYMVSHNEALAKTLVLNRAMFFGLIIAEFITVIVLSARAQTMSSAGAKFGFLLFAALNGITLSIIFFRYSPTIIGMTFGVTAGMFGATSLFGYITKKDLSGVGSFCMMALFGLIIAMVVNIFIGSGPLDYFISCAGVLIFVGLTAWDTQKIKQMAMEMDQNMAASDSGQKYAIFGALRLYLDFINMFLFMLRIFGGGRR